MATGGLDAGGLDAAGFVAVEPKRDCPHVQVWTESVIYLLSASKIWSQKSSGLTELEPRALSRRSLFVRFGEKLTCLKERKRSPLLENMSSMPNIFIE